MEAEFVAEMVTLVSTFQPPEGRERTVEDRFCSFVLAYAGYIPPQKEESSWSPSSSPCSSEFSELSGEETIRNRWTDGRSDVHNLICETRTDSSATEFDYQQSNGSLDKMRLNFQSKAERRKMKKLGRLSVAGRRKGLCEASEMRAHKQSRAGLKKSRRSSKVERQFPCRSLWSEDPRMQEGLTRHAADMQKAELKLQSNQDTDLSSCETDTLVTDEDIMVESGDDSWDLITCYCGKPFAGRPMIECEQCSTWVHLSCAKIKKTQVPDIFYCHRCRDSQYSTLNKEHRE